MNKILNYVQKGKGIGALWLFVFALLFSFWTAYNVGKILPQVTPYIQKIADDILPIKIENGVVVEPENTVKAFSYDIAGEPFSVVIDTTTNMLEEGERPTGFYLTKSYFYTVSDKQIRRQNLTNSIELPKQDYMPLMQKGINWTVGVLAVLGPVLMFIYFLIGVLFYAFCTGLACVLNKKDLTFKSKMRLNTVLFIGVYFIFMLFGFFGLNLSTLAFFCVMLVLQIVSVKYLKA